MFMVITLFVAGVMLVAGLGCASGPAGPIVRSTPTPLPLNGPVLVLDKLDVNMGSLSSDQQAVETFLIGNLGGQELVAQVVDLQVLEGCDAVDVAREPVAVPARQIVQLPVAIGPHRDLGPHRYSMTLESNDPARARRTLSVRFSVAEPTVSGSAGPDLVVDKTIVDTGDMPYDWPMYERFSLSNAGDQPLVIESAPAVRVETGC